MTELVEQRECIKCSPMTLLGWCVCRASGQRMAVEGVGLALLVASLRLLGVVHGAERPNVVIFFVDDVSDAQGEIAVAN